ncbi:MAG: NAD-dependent epimerase/dehydratase family protein [Alphaproteobacteria bacterium]
MPTKRTILVTGPTGFIGRRLVQWLSDRGFAVRPFGRDRTGDLSGDTDWRSGLDGVDTVIHLAGRAHVMNETESEAATVYNRINRDATEALAEQAEAAGVRRIVFVSTSKVMGEAGGPFSAHDTPQPGDPYSRSKLDAEAAIRRRDALQSVIIRPPLVYGPGVKGNFIELLKLVDKGLPLPFSAIHNRRSLIGLGNLCDVLIEAIDCPGGVYLPSDGETPSTPELIRLIARALGRKQIMLPVPVPLLKAIGRLSGRSAVIDRLTESFVVDGVMPGWTPQRTMAQELADTAQWFRTR